MKGRWKKFRSVMVRTVVPVSVLAILCIGLLASCSAPLSGGADAAAVASRATSGSVDFREESIYFLLPTRFIDGDPSNNVPTEWCSYNGGLNDITDPKDRKSVV